MNSNQRWWGWGTQDQTYDLGERPGSWPFLREELRLISVRDAATSSAGAL